jgi:starch synthase
VSPGESRDYVNNALDADPAILFSFCSVEAWSQSLSDMFFNQFRDARLAAENEARMREEARMIKRRGAQAFVRAVERRKVRHVLYTEPEVVKAGEEVTVFYNPSVTNLNGRERIYLRGGWNRWSHARKFGPLPMSPPAAGSSHWKAVVKAPLDAFKMDFVFSDVEEGDGTYDTRGGYDYHLPVEGSPVKEPSLYIAHIAVEMAPIAKVGGLGDVVTALGRAVKDQVRVPLY